MNETREGDGAAIGGRDATGLARTTADAPLAAAPLAAAEKRPRFSIVNRSNR
jgi:hypothetical protein